MVSYLNKMPKIVTCKACGTRVPVMTSTKVDVICPHCRRVVYSEKKTKVRTKKGTTYTKKEVKAKPHYHTPYGTVHGPNYKKKDVKIKSKYGSKHQYKEETFEPEVAIEIKQVRDCWGNVLQVPVQVIQPRVTRRTYHPPTPPLVTLEQSIITSSEPKSRRKTLRIEEVSSDSDDLDNLIKSVTGFNLNDSDSDSDDFASFFSYGRRGW